MPRILLLLTSLLIMISCHSESEQSRQQMGKHHIPDDAIMLDEEIEIEPPQTTSSPSPEVELEKGSKIIKNGSMQFEVDELESAKSKVDSILTLCNGYYENEQYNSYGNRISYSLQLRIPNIKFDSLIRVIENGVGELKSKNINAKDVTEEFVDLNIRLENNLAYLNQYKEILRKAKSVKEILEVQEKIRRIEAEINSKKGRIKYLNDKVKYSTLSLQLTQLTTTEVASGPSFVIRIADAFNNGVQIFLSFLVGLVSFWPFLILLGLAIFGRKSILKLIRKQK